MEFNPVDVYLNISTSVKGILAITLIATFMLSAMDLTAAAYPCTTVIARIDSR